MNNFFFSLLFGSAIFTTTSFAGNKSNEIIEERNIPLATSTFSPKKSHTVKARHLLRMYTLRLTPFFTVSFDHSNGAGWLRVTVTDTSVADNPSQFTSARIIVTADGVQIYSDQHQWAFTTVWGSLAKQTTITDPEIIREIADSNAVWLTVQYLGESGPFDHMSFQLSDEQQEDMRLFMSYMQAHAAEWANVGVLPSSAPNPQLPVTAPDATSLPPAREGVFHIGIGVTAPRILSKTEPAYTKKAHDAKIQGTVVLYLEVDTVGRATNLKVIRGLGFGLDEAAIEAVKTWTFSPGYKDGHPVTIASTIQVNFRLL